MNQEDFRQMLATRGGDERGYGGKRNLSEADLAEVKKLSAKKAKKKGKKPKNAAPADGVEAEHRPPKTSQYRDRAAERRKGGTGDMIDAEEYKHLDTEQSKFLGGDMEHTHLVKGLDYALLAQLKREKQKLLAEKQQQTQVERRAAALGNGRMETAKPREGKLTFKTRMGRLVYFHACQSTPQATTSVKSELFLPGRMYYTFNMSTAEIESIPVSVQRNKEDCPEPNEVASGIVDESLIDRVTELMSIKKGGKKMRKKKTKADHHHRRGKHDVGEEKADEDVPMGEADDAAAAVDIDDDEDIFPDVGEYVPIDQRTNTTSTDASMEETIKKAGYFSNLSASITEKEEATRQKEEDAERAWKETLQKAVEAQKKIEREKERREKEVKMTGEADDYAEYQGVGALGGDSDDEDDEETARRRKAAGLTDRKSDVDPEEKARRKKQKQSSKLANDLGKINKVRMQTW
ncbi:hypothetical protein PHYPSEUDO_001916 [Phytophthora pseudosyringae]|uniref:RED-like N-terminal domain-containing protein n=1 Tax=Phytophthora pseudosyringae TaxID=221518 RepID=A0A8T1WJU2_9STRA|nr:hypothetical protein PHYPSEUDO_001916 [Phytophthora pseudosyringae]